MSNIVDKGLLSMIKNLKEKTGKSLEDWVKIVKRSKLRKHGEIVKYLKTEQGLTHGYANLITHQALQSSSVQSSNSDLIGSQYSGEKTNLKPLYDELIKQIKKFGNDVEISPKKTYVSLRRNKQFAIIQPSTKTRLDVGINLKNFVSTERLEKSGSFNQMVSHRVKLNAGDKVDSELIKWLNHAYEKS
jgi:predicted transport protein